ncbi:P-loop containing nucleoside triphosphate hydrolase protein [Tricholoma matsutake]|nr:P-loop containing nucleoside triphosphate hydrolase protein [Tricholoma matsutake 945]
MVPSSPPAGTHRFSWGIFEVIYDYPIRTFAPFSGSLDYRNLRSALRFLCELRRSAPRPFAIHVLGCVWMSVAPALSLYFSSAILNMISMRTSIVSHEDIHCDGFLLQLYITLFSAALSTFVDRMIEENKLLFGAHLRLHFLPQLANVSLRLDIDLLKDHHFHGVLPDPWGFSEGAPALSFIMDLSARLRNITTLILEILVLFHIILVTRNPDAKFLASLCALCFTFMCFCPSNAIGGAGYTFYTKNKNFHRLHGLYRMVFDVKYRETLAKDSSHEYLSKEFKQTVDALGISKIDAVALAYYLPPPWYAVLSTILFIDYPMAVYALTLPWSLSWSSIATMALFQHASTTLRQSMESLRGSQFPASVTETMHHIRRFYEALDYNNNVDKAVNYPNHLSCSKGMRVSFRNISFAYGEPSSDHTIWALRNVRFDIEPGQLVVIVGGNGSGKTSLLKLLPRLNNPTCGEIFIDDMPLQDYDIHQLRHSMTFLTQSEDIYPVSIRENILMGLPHIMKSPAEKQEIINEAARLGGSYDIIQRLGYDTILDPPNVVGQSLRGHGNGDIGPLAMEELGCHLSSYKETSISVGEKQRLLASRTFMRVKNSDVRLLVFDEPTSALDPVAERDLFNHFRRLRNGITTIFVTHRFGHLVKHADLILCVKAGQIVQRGRHDDLIRHEKGEYARLFRSQAEQT